MKKFFVPIICLGLFLAFPSCDPKDPDDDDPDPVEETFVNKTPQTRNIILEEYTGINCGYCPDGHRLGDELHAAYPDKAWQINIHAGSYAAAYTTPEGTALNSSFVTMGYPAGVVSRELVKTGENQYVYSIGRSGWKSVAEQLMVLNAYVNVAAKTTINKRTRKLTCKVQAYFTDSSTVGAGKNFINIVLLQDNIWGNQSGATNFYPAMYDAATGKYKHNHMLRTFITGVGGEAMPTNTKGTLYSKTFTYTIPESISAESVVLDDLTVLVFVSQNDPTQAMQITQAVDIPRILNACKRSLTFE
jgi:hypothetical protein